MNVYLGIHIENISLYFDSLQVLIIYAYIQ